MEKLCRDCRWSNKPGSDNRMVACRHATSRYPVGNRPAKPSSLGAYRWLSCGSARWAGHPEDGCCGPAGKFWEPSELRTEAVEIEEERHVEPSEVSELAASQLAVL
jgi:hypothetical protein